MRKDKYGALFFLLISVAYGLKAFDIPLTILAQRETFNARTLPFGLAVAGVVLSFLILVLPSVDEKDGSATLKQTVSGLDWKRVFLLLGLMVFYGLVMKFLGFVIASVLFLLGGMWVLGERRLWLMLLSAIPLVLFIWVLMAQLLGMYIAPGEVFYLLGVI
jgi:putative tricarboxylic transport membrane protein